MSATKLTETQQIVLSAAAQRGDRCVMLPPRLKGAAAQRIMKKLVDLGLIEEVRARGDLPVWRRDRKPRLHVQNRGRAAKGRPVRLGGWPRSGPIILLQPVVALKSLQLVLLDYQRSVAEPSSSAAASCCLPATISGRN